MTARGTSSMAVGWRFRMMRSSGRLVAAMLLASAPVFADKPPKAKGKSKAQGAEVVFTFTTSQREKAQAYFVEQHGRGGCPPGLAKKNNGCLPPGQAKKRYTVGTALPGDIPTRPISAELSIRIGAPPAGYTYVMLDGDLLKLAVGTLLVVDAIVGLVD
jgi:hypothetical protein